jgi:hypothetical protein
MRRWYGRLRPELRRHLGRLVELRRVRSRVRTWQRLLGRRVHDVLPVDRTAGCVRGHLKLTHLGHQKLTHPAAIVEGLGRLAKTA